MIKLQHHSLKPILGTYIVSREPVPEQAYKDLMPEESLEPILEEQRLEQAASKQAGIHILTAGFNQLNLVPILDVM
jgi:hypothetical protein